MKKRGFQSICIKDQLIESNNSHITPIYSTSAFTYPSVEWAQEFFQNFDNGFAYSRMGNPTNSAVADKIALLEGYGIKDSEGKEVPCYGKILSSGMAAISAAVLSSLKSGDKLITQGDLYGTTNELFFKMLPQWGIEAIITDLNDLSLLDEQLSKDECIKLIYIETPANPLLTCYDIEAISKIAKKYNALTVVDNTFATPYLQQPLKLGADIVVHSSTKYLNGHSTGISGIVVAKDKAIIEEKIQPYIKILGVNLSPFESFLLNNGVKTLSLRMNKHNENAMQLSLFLNSHSKIAATHYLGLESHPSHLLAKKQMSNFGGMLSFELKDGYDAALKFIKNIQFCSFTATLGAPDTLIQHPASMTHSKVPKIQREKYGITDGLIRVSVGLEDIEDVINDFKEALNAI